MVTEYIKPPREIHVDGKAKEFENLLLKNIPNWHAIWSMMLDECREFSMRAYESPVDLEDRIQRKITELVEKENTLVDLYQEAAEHAKKAQEEFNIKTAFLIEQIEKDKNLMKTIKNS